MRKALLTFALTLLLALAFVGAQAQNTTFPAPWYFAANYGNWTITGQQANTYTFFPTSLCQVPNAQTGTFFPFATTAPVYVQDVVAANSEVLTPSAIIQTSAQCGITISPSHSHYSFWLRSGTGGLQEALNALSTSGGYAAPIYLDRNWYTLAAAVPGTTPAAIIAAATGSTGAYLIDLTTAPSTFYTWNGSAYVASASSSAAGSVRSFCTGTVGSAETEFLNGAACSGATTSTAKYLVAAAGTLSGLRIASSAAVTGGTGKDVATVLKNGSATTITCTIAGTGTACSDTTHSVAVAAGDLITFSFVTATSDTAANITAVVSIH
jgi:hypothetical protein